MNETLRVSVPTPKPPAESPPVVEILQVMLSAVWRRRYVVLLPALILPLLGLFVGQFAPSTYETKMTILIQEPGKLNPFLEDLAIKTNLKDRMAALTALLTSRYVMQAVAEDMNMLKPGASESEVDRVVADLGSSVSVQLIGQELVELRFRAASPVGSDKALRRIGERFMERVAAPEDSSMRGSVTFLDTELSTMTKRLEAAEADVAQYRSQNIQSLPEQRGANLQRLATLREQLAERETRLAGALSEFSETRSRLARTDPVIGRLEQDIVATRGDLAVLRSRYTDDHSKVQAALRRLERLEEERASMIKAGTELTNADVDRMWNLAAVAKKEGEGAQPLLVSQVAILEAARTRLEQVKSELTNLQNSIAALSDALDKSGDVERELGKRQRAVAETQELVQALRKRFEMAKVTGELSRFQAPERIKVIDRPAVPTRPMKPLALLFALGGLVGGLFLGIGLATLLELSDTSIRRIRQMEALTGLKVLARIAPLGPDRLKG